MGGAEVFTREIAKGLTKAGNQVTLFTSEFPNCKAEEVSEGIRIVRRGGKISVYLEAKKQYRERFSKERFDIIIDEINTRPFFAHRFINNNEKVFALIHQLAREYWFYETSFPINYLGFYLLENRWLKKYQNIPTLTVSESTKIDLQKIGFKKIFVLPEGLNFKPIDKIPQKSSEPLIVFSGRLNPAKRPDHLISAFAQAKKRVPKARLLIIGEGKFRKTLEKMDISGVEFLGHLNNSQRREILKKAWLLVNPSVREGFGLNIIEANAFGTPCVAYNVPGLKDSVKDKETGLLVKAGDVKDLADKIEALLLDEELRINLGKEALCYSRHFSWEKSVSDLLGIITH